MRQVTSLVTSALDRFASKGPTAKQVVNIVKNRSGLAEYPSIVEWFLTEECNQSCAGCVFAHSEKVGGFRGLKQKILELEIPELSRMEKALKQSASHEVLEILKRSIDIEEGSELEKEVQNAKAESLIQMLRGLQEATVEEATEVLRQLRDLGLVAVHFIGGETTLFGRENPGDLVKVAGAAKDLGFSVSMVSNGSHIVGLAKNRQLDSFDRLFLSLDHSDPKKNDLIRDKHAYRMVMRAIGALREHYPDTPVTISATLDRDNARDVRNMIRLCSDLGIWIYLNPRRPTANINEAVGEDDGRDYAAGFENDQISQEKALALHEQVWIWRLVKQFKKRGYRVANSYPYLNQMMKAGRTGIMPLSKGCGWPKLALEIFATLNIGKCNDWASTELGNIRDEEGKIPDGRMKALLDSNAYREHRKLGDVCEHCTNAAWVSASNVYNFHQYPAEVISGPYSSSMLHLVGVESIRQSFARLWDVLNGQVPKPATLEALRAQRQVHRSELETASERGDREEANYHQAFLQATDLILPTSSGS